MRKPGYQYDNRCMESFFASLKKEYLFRKEYAKMEMFKKGIFFYIEIFYNRKRLYIS